MDRVTVRTMGEPVVFVITKSADGITIMEAGWLAEGPPEARAMLADQASGALATFAHQLRSGDGTPGAH